MKLLLILISLLTLTSEMRFSKHGKWIIDSSSRLLIHGKSNVNSFTCSISCYNRADTLHYTIESGEFIFGNNTMMIPVQDFDCGNTMITKDLRRTVKAVKNPHLIITFISMDRNSSPGANAQMAITLAGVTKYTSIEFIQHTKDGLLQLTGKHLVSFKDFGLVPPKHVLGLVRVQKELNVEFNLLIKTVE
jgi:hypothetical protein